MLKDHKLNSDRRACISGVDYYAPFLNAKKIKLIEQIEHSSGWMTCVICQN
jgi:hypothetical protein